MSSERGLRAGALVLASALSGCVFITQGDIEARDVVHPPPTETGTDLPDPIPGNVLIQVVDTAGFAASGAEVTVDGARIGVTDAAGWVSKEGLTDGWHALTATGPRGITTGGAVEIVHDQTRVVTLHLAPHTRQGVVHRPSRGGAITRDGQYALVFDDDAFVDAPEAPVTVTYAWVEPASASGPLPFGEGGIPLDLLAVTWIGDARASGEKYAIDPTKPGTIRIPAPAGAPVLRVFHFDEATGFWVDTGAAENEPAYLTGAFEGAGWWAIGSAGGTLGCLSGALSVGLEAAGASVTHVDPTRPLPTVGWADEQGTFCVPAPAGHAGRMEVSGATFALDRRFGGVLDEATANRTAECGPDCTDVGEIPVEAFEDGDQDGFFGGVGGDCDDADDEVVPGLLVDAPGDGTDQNCDGLDGVDADHDGNEASAATDCDDVDPDRGFGLPEVCDDVDNDCDDRTDEGVPASVDDPSGGCLSCGPQAIADLGPKLYLHFDDVTGRTADSSGFGFDGTINGIDQTRTSVAEDGLPAPWFNGTLEDHVMVSNFTEMGTEEVTVSMFVRPSLTRRTVFSYAVDRVGTEPIECAANMLVVNVNPGDVSLRIRDWSLLMPGGEALDAWEHLVVMYRSTGVVTLYKNASKVFEGQLTTFNQSGLCEEPVPDPPEDVHYTLRAGGSVVLGADQDCVDGCTDSDTAFEGVMDEVAVFDRILTQDEISAIYDAVTCGEGLACDDLDNDGDGATDEHLLGSDNFRCLAETCDEIAASEADVGDGLYWVEFQSTPLKTTCSFPETDACSCRICGDGVVADFYESCDEAGPGCRECAFERGPLMRSCADILADDPSATDGIYWIYPDPLTPLQSYKVRCNFTEDGGGWTLVVNQDTRGGTAFYDPVPDLDGENHTYSGGTTAGLFDWRAARTTDPFAGSYSILGQLENFRGTCGFDFRMVWPFDGPQSIAWTQTSNPTTDPVAGYAPIDVPNFPTVQFRGLRKAYGLPSLEDAYIYPDTDPDEYYATALMMADFDENIPATWFPMGLYPLGVARDKLYRLWASPDISADGTVRGSELWVRPCTP